MWHRHGQEGATSSEYALMAGLIAVVIAVSVGLLGEATIGLFERFTTGMRW